MVMKFLRGLPFREVAKDTAMDFLRDDMPTYSAALAYQLFLAVFPFLLFLLALLSFLELSALFDQILLQARRALPAEAMGRVEDVLAEVEDERRGDLLSLGILFSVWIASAGMRSVMNALNRAYNIEETRPRTKLYPLSIGYTLAFSALVVLATALMVVGPQWASALASYLNLGEEVLLLWSWLRIPTALFLAAVAVSLVYYFAPSLRMKYRIATPGAVVAVLLWVAVSWGFQLYVNNFGRYSVTYGSVGAVIILLLYFYLSSVVLLLGGEMNAVLYKRRPKADEVPE